MFQTTRIHQTFNKLSRRFTRWEDVMTFGIWLNCDPDDLTRLCGSSASIPLAVYEIMRSFFTSKSCTNAEKWSVVKESLTEVGLLTAITECGVDQLLDEAQYLGKGGNCPI